jgi:hypothetical protein
MLAHAAIVGFVIASEAKQSSAREARKQKSV